MNAGLPDNCRTKLECRTCQGDLFRACWNWTPIDGDGRQAARWEIGCAQCGAMWVLSPAGLPNPGEIHGAEADPALFTPFSAGLVRGYARSVLGDLRRRRAARGRVKANES